MLVLRRKQGEAIEIGNGIVVVVGEIRSGDVKLIIHAPREVAILRSELIKSERESDDGERL